MRASSRFLATASLLAATVASAQSNLIRRDTGVINRSPNPLLANFRLRSIGPEIGRAHV